MNDVLNQFHLIGLVKITWDEEYRTLVRWSSCVVGTSVLRRELYFKIPSILGPWKPY